MISNRDIAKILSEIAAYLDMDEVPFKPRAYEKAAEAIGSLDRELSDIYKEGGIKALEDVPGVGASIAEKIEELLKTDRLGYYEKLKKKMPVDMSGLIAVGGVGPKHVKTLWEKLRVKTVADLEKAARAGKIRKLAHFGEKSEEKILQGVEFLKRHAGRFPIFEALPIARAIEEQLARLPEVKKIVVAGSIRRCKETIGDIDILVVSEKPESVMDAFVSFRDISSVIAKGDTKSAVRFASGLEVDLRVVPPESFGAALNYFTGSKAHNVALREIAVRRGWKLNEYGLLSGRRRIAGKTEEEIYKKLGLAYIEPELREDVGEIDAARTGKLPELITEDDLRGDLQIQTDWTDGAHSIEEMARAAKDAGLSYIAITDHTKNLAMTHGADEKKLLKQIAFIDKLNKKLQVTSYKFHVLKGVEVDILKDGSLDIRDDILSKLDVAGAAVHTNTSMTEADMTRRIIRAMENPHVDIIFHPTGRIVGRREPYRVNMEELIKAAKRTGTILEVDGCERLDLKDEYIRRAVDANVKLAIDSDAHSMNGYSWLAYGVMQARRGWAAARDVVNTKSAKELSAFFKKPKKSRW